MKRMMLALLLCLCACGVQKPQIEYRDSVRIEYRDRVVVDTAKIIIEREVEKIVTRDTSSHLENSYAKSDAVVSEGMLHHTLESIPQIIKVPVYVPVTDTLWMESGTQVVEKEVPAPLSWWQRVRLDSWWIILGLFAIAALLLYLRR